MIHFYSIFDHFIFRWFQIILDLFGYCSWPIGETPTTAKEPFKNRIRAG